MARLRPLDITAHLQQGIVLDTLFGIALDGLLASAIRDRSKAERSLATGTIVTGSLLDGGLHTPVPATIDLPLARCQHPEPDQWHWMCTTAQPLTPDGDIARGDTDVHHHHSRVRERLVDHTVQRIPAALPPGSGRYRMRRMPVVSTPAARVRWRAVGDPDDLGTILSALFTIGRGRHTGEGAVLGWEITENPTGDPDAYGHLHSDLTLGRPTPQACAEHLDIDTSRTGTAGLRPPYWHPHTQHHVVLPEPLRSPPISTEGI